MVDGVPRGIELDKDELKFFSGRGKVVGGEDEDVVFFSVWIGEEDEPKQEEYLSQHMKYRSEITQSCINMLRVNIQ